VTARVAVIVPCYDLGRYLDEAIESVRAQSFRDVELVIVDDGSTEPETCAKLAAHEAAATRVVRSPNRGLPAAKNLGLAETKAPYVCLLDADDRLLTTMLQKSVAALDADPSLAFVSHWVRHFGDESRDWTPSDCGFPALLDLNTLNGAALVRRSALDAVGGFDESMREGCEDWEAWIRLVERGFRGDILREVLYEYRRRPGSMSRVMVQGDRQPRIYRQIVEKHAATFGRYASALVARRETDLGTLQREVHDLDLEYHSRIGPALAKRRDDVAVLERKKKRADAEAAERAEQLAARREVEALRQSASWRLTAPLRALYERLGLARPRNER
jgi:glycosyltransferase involved in cell wall biosynthesis